MLLVVDGLACWIPRGRDRREKPSRSPVVGHGAERSLLVVAGKWCRGEKRCQLLITWRRGLGRSWSQLLPNPRRPSALQPGVEDHFFLFCHAECGVGEEGDVDAAREGHPSGECVAPLAIVPVEVACPIGT